MKIRSVFALCVAMLVSSFTFAADLVSDYIVDGTTYTRTEGWSALDVGITIVMKYENLPAEGDATFMTLSQYTTDNKESKAGLCSRARSPRGMWNGSYWNDAQNTSTATLDESGVVVCVYHPDSDCGLIVYDANGSQIFGASKLKSTAVGSTVGKKIVITEYVTDVAIYQGEVAADGIAALVEAFTAEPLIPETGALPEATAFSWVPGSAPTGWFTGWGGEAGGSPVVKMIGPSGTIDSIYRVYNEGGNDKWHPWNNLPVKNAYTLSLYGCVDMIETPAKGSYAVLWAMGSKAGQKTVLALNEQRKITLVSANGSTIEKTIVGPVIKGYHLLTVAFDETKGAALVVDAEDAIENASLTTSAVSGFQVGSVYGGNTTTFDIARGLVVLNMVGYDTLLSKDAISSLATQYPAAETITETITINQIGNSIYLPSITIPDGKQLRVQKGTLVVPAGVEATLGALEFGDINTGDLGFGLELNGTINIVNSKTFTSNDEKTAYDACNAGRGVNFGEWAGTGTFIIRGTFNAPDTVVVLVHDSSKVTINVDGGTVNAKGITAKEPERATINLANGAKWTYSEKVSEGDSVTLNEEGEYSIVSDNGAYKLTRAAEEDYVFTETQTVSRTLSGAVSVTVNPGEGGVVTFTTANTFTGGLVVESGTAKTTNATGFGPNNYNSWATPDALGQIEVKADATLDLANTKDTCYAIAAAGTITNSGSDIGTTNRQTVKIALSGDATVSGNTFGLLAPNNNATTLDLGGYTLTVAMNEGKSFILSNTTITGAGTIKLKSGSLWINQNKSLTGTIKLDLSEFPTDGGVVAVGSATQLEKIVLAEGQKYWSLIAEGTTLTAKHVVVFDPDKDQLATTPVLRFSEIMPKPSDKPGSITTEAGYDKNGLESGWVELENTSETEWADLADYKFCRANRGKVYTHADYGNFPSGTYIPPRGRFTFYTSERYSNSYPEAKDGNTSAFQHGTFDGKPIWYGDMLIWGDKVNPKKFPYVTLVYRPSEATADTILETVIIPSDTPEGYSIIVGHDEGEGVATQRWLCPSPTKNAANSDTTKLKKIGPNVGPAYGTKHSATEFGPTAPAKPSEPYTVSLNVNPVYTAAGTRPDDVIQSVTLVYRRDLDDETIGRTPMTKTGSDEGGDVWTGTIPVEDIPAAGHLLQWKTEIIDMAENKWTSPSFMNPDDGYEWFGTITEPGGLNSAKLPTWHMFAEALSLKWMDTDADAQSKSEIPNQARVAIYDSSTSNYYDYVRIDLRGNSSARFNKKSHGLRFSKAHPLTMKDGVRGGEVKEIRKSSLIGEPADPSFMRQMIGFWLWDKMGNKVPFDFPVRCNLNGEFFQLGFHSERFTDELIEDVYGLDKYGYGYKNIGQMNSGLSTTAGGIEKKTPDDGNEKDYTVLRETLTNPMHALGVDSPSNDNVGLTKFVVESFNLPAWLNYIASARITHEMDDVWANISGYYDDAQMLEGKRGTATWMPLGYDFNVSFGQYYHDGIDLRSQNVLMANQDWFKSHPFYGGEMVRCHSSESAIGTSKDLVNDGNRGIEAVLQSSKFRRLYLRRLRTLMDQELKAPGTPESKVPFMVKMREMAELMKEDAVLDHDKYGKGKNGWNSSFGAIDSWGETNWPATISNGVDNIWEKYVVPRQTHLYVTHSVTNTTKEVGYGETFNAGIPLAQSPIDALKEGLSAEAVDGGIVIRNANDEAVDLSGWDVTGPVIMKLPAGTVIDMMANSKTGEVFVVTDRRAYVAANAVTLSDEVIVGNAKVGSGTDIGLTAADGTIVLSADVILAPGTYTGVSYDVPVTLSPAGSFTFAGATFNGGLNLVEGDYKLKNDGSATTNTASVVNGPAANITFTGKGTFELVGTATTVDPLMSVGNLIVSNGVFSVESKSTTDGVKAVVVAGDFVVEDKGTVSVKLSKKTVNGIAISQELKNKVCRIGKGGKFYATLNGVGGSAINSTKGTVNLGVEDGSTVVVDGAGSAVNGFKMAGKILVSGGSLNVVLPKGNAFSGAKGVDFTGTANVFAIGGAEALHGVDTKAADISGKEIKIWTVPVITGVDTVKLFMMIDGQIVTLAPESWDEIEVTESTTVEELIGEEQAAKLKAHQVAPAKIVEWAKTHSTHTKPGETIDLEAFALDCAPGAVAEKKKAFKVTITFDPESGKPVVTKADGVSLNIEPIIEGSSDLINWHDKEDGDAFFKAVIRLGE